MNDTIAYCGDRALSSLGSGEYTDVTLLPVASSLSLSLSPQPQHPSAAAPNQRDSAWCVSCIVPEKPARSPENGLVTLRDLDCTPIGVKSPAAYSDRYFPSLACDTQLRSHVATFRR